MYHLGTFGAKFGKIDKKLTKMAGRYYFSSAVIRQTMYALSAYKQEHPESMTPMADALEEWEQMSDEDKNRGLRAARRLGWDVNRSYDSVFENGIRVW